MQSGAAGKKKKRRYVPPTIAKLPLEKARQFIVERTNCSNQEATQLLESMREELREREKD